MVALMVCRIVIEALPGRGGTVGCDRNDKAMLSGDAPDSRSVTTTSESPTDVMVSASTHVEVGPLAEARGSSLESIRSRSADATSGFTGADHSRTRPVIAVTSRPPLVQGVAGRRTAPGGLAPIVRATLDRRGGAWVSWNSNNVAPSRTVDGLGFQVFTFTLGRKTGEAFHGGYANRTLWPLFHDLVAQPVFDPSWWSSYRDANSAYARAAHLAAGRADGEALFWVHDYHLMLVPARLRELGATNPIAFFLHTPFPSPSVFARLPERTELLEGLAGADAVSFHTEADRQRFEETWSSMGRGPSPHTATVPASIDVEAFRAGAGAARTVAAAKALRRRLGHRILLLGVERLDYTKGIPERLQAIETLLLRRRDLRRRVAYVQLATPSREHLPEYRKLRTRVEREIGRLNGRFTAPGYDVPFRYLHRSVTHQQLLAYYLAADVALVTPLRDGMNLVAKEFVVVQAAGGGRGTLVLSEFAGAATELTDAFICNPYDTEKLADAIEDAIDLDDESRRKRLDAMAEAVASHDAHRWADRQLTRVENCRSGVE